MEKKNNEMTLEEYRALQEGLDAVFFIPRFNDFITHVNTAFRVYAGVKNYEYLEYTAQDIETEAHSEKMLFELMFTMRDIMEKHEGCIPLPIIDSIRREDVKIGGES